MRSTGWYGIPGVNRYTKVHVVENGKPICGSQIGDRMEYQWCANHVHWEYIKCERCKQKIRNETSEK